MGKIQGMFASRGTNVSVLVFDSLKVTTSGCKQSVNTRGRRGGSGYGGGGEEGDYIPTATLSPPECLLH